MLGDGGAGEGGEFEEVLVCPLVEEKNKIVYNTKKCT